MKEGDDYTASYISWEDAVKFGANEAGPFIREVTFWLVVPFADGGAVGIRLPGRFKNAV